MRKFLYISILGLVLAGCSTLNSQSPICMEVEKAKANPQVSLILDAQNPATALGELWLSAKASCQGSEVKAEVSPDWAGMVWGEVKALAPILLPILLGLI